MSCLLFTFTKPNIILGHNVISIAKKECSHKGACIPAFVPSCFHHHDDYISAEKIFFPLPPIPLCHESGDLLCVYHLVHSLGEFLAPPLLKIIQIIQYYCCELMRLFYNQLNCHSDKWPNNANTRVASLSVVLQRNNSVTSMRAPELTFRVSA